MHESRSARLRRAIIAVAACLGVATMVAPVAASATEPPTLTNETTSFAALAESTPVADAMKRLYITVFDREADAVGLKYWLEQIASGAATYEDAVWAFQQSTEWQNTYGGTVDDGAFLDLLYQNVLDRAADDVGKSYWLELLSSGELSRTEVLAFFSESNEQIARTPIEAEFSLDILHINDHHSHVEEDDLDLQLGELEAEVTVGGFPRVVTAIDELSAASTADGVAKIHAGDAITGTLFYSLFKGEVDAALMNEVCFDVFALGNHEFDDSDAGLANFLDDLNADPDCDTVTVAANVVPEVGTPLAPNAAGDYIQPYSIETYGDEQVAFVGIDIAQKTQVSSSPLDSTQFLDEVATAQAQIDELTGMGIDKIVLVTHQGYGNDQAMASMLSGVDVIVGGDSHSLLGDFSALGLNSQGEYPTRTVDKTGLPVCIVQAWEYALVVGELSVSFDSYGHVDSCDGTPHLLIGDTFIDERGESDVPYAGAELASILEVVASTDELRSTAPDADATTVLSGFDGQVAVLNETVIGTASEALCVGRIPNDGRSGICSDTETPQGGDIQQLVTYAFADRAFDADIALQNSGGVRIDIPAGDVTIGDAYTLLPFANTIVNLEMTGAEVKQALEDGVANILDNGGSSGAYPYAAYLRWDMDFTAAAGERVTNLEYRAKGTDTWVAFDLTATYTVASNSFMANGGDGYETLAAVVADGRSVDTFIDYAQGFIDYLEQDLEGTLSKVPASDYSTKSFTPAAG